MNTEIQNRLFQEIQRIEARVRQREMRLITLLQQQSEQQQLLSEQVESLASQLNNLQRLLLDE